MKATTFQASLDPGPAIAPGDTPFLHSVLPAAGSDLLAALGQASFSWDIAGDTLHWSDNVAAVLRDIPQPSLSRASEYSKLIEPIRAIRNDAVLNSTVADGGAGVPYQIEYGLRASTSSQVLWIDECGRWFAGADGKPSRARGIIRVNNERHARNEQLLKLSQDDPLTGEFNRTRL
ncbi:MAG: GGDEF-domain containing protein, partial [Afipia sp.]